MKKYPFVKQQGAKDCGAACLLMLIKYYNGYISIKDLKEMTKTNKNGTTLYNLVISLREIGFEADGISCSFDDLIKSKINLPFICSVTINNTYKHFIVVYEIKLKYILIGDPSVGIRKVTIKYFKQIYNNAIILAICKKKLPVMSDEKNYNLNKIIKRNKDIILVVISYSLFITIFSIINSFYFGKLVDNLDTNNILIFTIFIMFSVLCFLRYTLEYIKNRLFIFLNKRIDIELTMDIFNSILSLPYKHYKNHTSGDIISRINDLYNLKDFISKVMICIFIDLPISLVSLIILLKLNISLFFISFIILIINIIFLVIFKKITYIPMIKLKSLKSSDTSIMLDSINGFETVKGINIKNRINNKVINNHIKYLNYEEYFTKLLILREYLKNIVNDIGIIIIDYVGIIFVNDNKITLSTLITFNTIMSYFFISIKSITETIFNINDAKSSLKRINDIMTAHTEIGFLNTFENGEIKVKNLIYTFDDLNYTLNDVTLNIKNHEKLLVIGKSGSGKSTLFKIIKGYYKVDYDKITINNIDINNYKDAVLSNNIIYVNQSEILFSDTLLNNINISNKNYLKVLEICNICEIKPIIKNNNLGFNMIVEDNGFNLSGGERQRIVLARSLLCDFEILILDEALNQVDILMEKRILEKLFKYFKNKTIIFISHRLNNTELFDHIIEMKKGKIIKNVFRKA